MPVEGAIANAARGFLPVTWDALSKDTERYGDGFLQTKIDLIVETIFGVQIPVAEEDTYPLRVINYAGKLVALELIAPGIDFWMNETQTITTTGTNEIDSYVDRPDKLRQLYDRLAWEARRDEPMIFALLGRPRPQRGLPRPDISTDVNDVLLTPSPREFPAPFKQGTGTQRLT